MNDEQADTDGIMARGSNEMHDSPPPTPGLPDKIPDNELTPTGCAGAATLFGGAAMLFGFSWGMAIIALGLIVPLLLVVLAFPTVLICGISAYCGHWVKINVTKSWVQSFLFALVAFIPPVMYGVVIFGIFTLFVVGLCRYFINETNVFPVFTFGIAFIIIAHVWKLFFVRNYESLHEGRLGPFYAGITVQVLCVLLYFAAIFQPQFLPGAVKAIPYARHVYNNDQRDVVKYLEQITPLLEQNKESLSLIENKLLDQLAKFENSPHLAKAIFQTHINEAEVKLTILLDDLEALKPPERLKSFHEVNGRWTKQQLKLLADFKRTFQNESWDEVGVLTQKMVMAEAQATIDMEKSLKESGLDIVESGPALKAYMDKKAKGM